MRRCPQPPARGASRRLAPRRILTELLNFQSRPREHPKGLRQGAGMTESFWKEKKSRILVCPSLSTPHAGSIELGVWRWGALDLSK